MPAKTSRKKPVDNKKTSKKSAVAGRNILFSPWRYPYIKNANKGVSNNGCVFCGAVNKGAGPESLVLYDAKTCFVILNKFPYNNGHLMVIPRRHTSDFQSLDQSEFEELHLTLRRAHGALTKAYKPDGMNIGMNLGRMAGAGIVDHLHYHLVPRWGGDTNFMPVIGGTKVISENLEQTFEKLLPLFR